MFIVEGKGGHQRLIPVSARFFSTVAGYLRDKRPAGCATDRVFVVLKGPNRGRPLSPAGLDEILRGARRRASLAHLTCQELSRLHATLLFAAGVNPKVGSERLGHSSVASILDTYAHVMPGMQPEAAEMFDALVFRNAEGSVSGADGGTARRINDRRS